MRYWRDRGGLPVWRQLMEILVLRAWRGLGPNYYLLGRFWRRNLSWREKLGHISEGEYKSMLRRMNPREYRKASQHKVVEKAVLTLLGFPTPRFLGFFHSWRGRAWDGKPLSSAEDLLRFLRDCPGSRVAVKPVEGWGGAEFRAFEVLRGDGGCAQLRDLASGAILSADALANQLVSEDGYILEAYIEQHGVTSTLNASSLNTLRIWVVRVGAETRFAGAILRVGRYGALVDNISAGGLVCPVDVETGRVIEVRESTVMAEPRATHPDGEAVIAGVTVPYWHEIRALADQSLGAFPNVRFAGLDIAVSPDGPQLIEINVVPDLLNAVDFDVPLRGLFDMAVAGAR